MKLEKFENEICEALSDAVKDAIRKEEDNACVTVDTNDGYLDIYVSRKGDMDLIINHDNNHNYTMPNLQAWVEGIVCEYKGYINWLYVELDMLDDVDTSPEAEYYNPGITSRVCWRAIAFRKQIEALKKAQK